MPIFEFTCDKCDKSVEKIMSFDESEGLHKCECGEGNLKKHTASNFNFSLKGQWFKNTGGY